jgi:hypothetical protein
MRIWLKENVPIGDLEWLPFIDGVRYPIKTRGQEPEYLQEFRLFRNGAASFRSTVSIKESTLSGVRFVNTLDFVLRFAAGFYEQIRMAGDMLIDVTLFDATGLTFEPGVSLTITPGVDLRWYGETLQFAVATGAIALLTNSERWALERRIMDRLAQCFGLWTVPYYFNEDGLLREWRAE